MKFIFLQCVESYKTLLTNEDKTTNQDKFDQTKLDQTKLDKMFGEQRLIGTNPAVIRRVTAEDYERLVKETYVSWLFTYIIVPHDLGYTGGLNETLLTLPAQPHGLVSYSFPYIWLKIFFFLATRLFHIFPWPILVKVAGTWTTTHAQTMVGSEVMMGSLGSKRPFSPKRHQILQNA